MSTQVDISTHNYKVFEKYAESTRKRILKAMDDVKQPMLEYLETEIASGGGWVYDHQTKYNVPHTHSISMWTADKTAVSGNSITVRLENDSEHPYTGKNYSQYLIGEPYQATASGLTEAEWNNTKQKFAEMAKDAISSALKSRKVL